MASLLIRNARLVLPGRGDLPSGSVLVEGERIAGVFAGSDGPAQAGEVVDGRGLAVMPGLVNAHHHSYSNVLRGTRNDLRLESWALYTVAHGYVLDSEAIRLAALLGAAEAMRHGVTAMIDHAPHIAHAEAALEAHRESGLRVGYAPFMHDRSDHDLLGVTLPPDLRPVFDAPNRPPQTIAEFYRRLVREWQGRDGRLQVMLGPNAPQRCSPELLDLWGRLAGDLGLRVHTHLCETVPQANYGRREWGGTVQEMDRRGLLNDRLSVAHGIWLEESERDLLAKHGVTVSHNPASNLMLGSGSMPLVDYLKRGVPVALGSDSANTGGGANLFEVMRIALMLPRPTTANEAEWPTPQRVFALASEGGAGALGVEAGRLETGRLADLVLVRLDTPLMAAAEPSLSTLVMHGGAHAVQATMVGGRFVYRDGKVLAFDEAAMLRRYQAAAARIVGAAADRLRLAERAEPCFTKLYPPGF